MFSKVCAGRIFIDESKAPFFFIIMPTGRNRQSNLKRPAREAIRNQETPLFSRWFSLFSPKILVVHFLQLLGLKIILFLERRLLCFRLIINSPLPPPQLIWRKL